VDEIMGKKQYLTTLSYNAFDSELKTLS